jgi:tight adherence protein B
MATRMRRVAALADAGLSLELSMPAQDALTSTSRMVICVVAAARMCGAPVAQVARHLAHTCDRLAEQHDRIVEALAGPRMARRILLWLPVAAFPLTSLLGFDVAGVLFGSQMGLVLLIVSAGLTMASALWTRALVRVAESMPPAPGLYARLMAVGISAGMGWSAADENTMRALAATDAFDLLDVQEVEQASAERAQTTRTGIPLHGVLMALENQAVDDAFHASSIRVRELGEKLLLPLGACTLPSFLCLGIFPALVSVISNTAHGLA